MSNTDFTTTITVDQSPEEVFNAINNVRGWWSEEIEGGTEKLNDIYLYHYKDVHIVKIKLTEVVPSKKIAWIVLDNYFSFTTDQTEWVGTKIIFEITKKGDKTELHFTHQGLVPQYECYKICHDAWTNYIQNSLKNLITTGKGQPNPKEGGFNSELLRKWNINE
ncbi:MAG: SRPBCC domain-containing protein [Chitinophagaceae bacterium]